ncbi:hypothetical protein HPO96_30800 [Kribbella sandramycini]|uniref:Enoyl reductase n=1 Tax=Kribbella sandramycini TaxID=60450 RepID=A0A7Y4P2C6_9ACTN|nr:hypothetical protein [Kribbella sandramycini]MBB6566924.1 hypothetical protein [Kribbella sandramycini]NOL44646.1 hypothetical protein [Kribbella sandramycini]
MLSRQVLAALGTASAVTLSLVAGTLQAHAELVPPPPTPGASGNTISVRITGTGIGNGKGGRPGRPLVKQVPVPCNYIQGMTGKQYYEYIAGGAPLGRDKDGVPFKPHPGYEQYKDDDEGHWYGGMCSSELFGHDMAAFNEFITKWFAEHPAIYVPAGGRPPVPPVPPVVLRDAAFEAMTVPPPAIDWNPKYSGSASVVNLDTWVWLRDRRTVFFVEASVDSIAGRISARVDANLTGMTVSTPTDGSADCADGGVPYARGAVGECSIKFRRASPAGSGTPVTVQTRWETTWLSNGVPQGLTPEQLDPPPLTTNVPVTEVQTHNR